MRLGKERRSELRHYKGRSVRRGGPNGVAW
jgi:hypothetical protein